MHERDVLFAAASLCTCERIFVFQRHVQTFDTIGTEGEEETNFRYDLRIWGTREDRPFVHRLSMFDNDVYWA